MVVIRRSRNSQNQVVSKSRFAIAIDERTGFKHKQKDMLFEPGTGYYVHRKESDGFKNLVSDPLNYPSPKLRRPERIALKHPSPDVPLVLGVVISADQLGLPSHASTFYSSTVWPSIGTNVSAGTSISTGTCAGGLNFSLPQNSQYYVIIFQGI
jgi:hypothetical protein